MFTKRWKSALFFCLLVLLDEFCVKTQYVSSSYHITPNKLHSSVLTADNSVDDVADNVYQSNITSDVSTRKEKRAIFVAILVGASIAASLANLGFDIYLHIKGCCGVYSATCRYRDEFESLKKTLTKKSKSVDDIYTTAENTKQWVKQCNYQNRELWLNVHRIADVQNELVEALTVEVIIAFDNTSSTLKKRIRQKNATVLGLSGQQLEVTFESAFSSTRSTLLSITGVVGHVGSILIGKAMTSYKYNKMANFLKTSEGSRLINAKPKAQKLFGVSKTNINQHFKATAKAQYKANYKPVRAKIASGATAVFAIIAIGLEIYSAVMKVKACQKMRDNAYDAVRNMRKANSEMDTMLTDVKKYRTDVTVNGWNKIKSELESKDLGDILTEIRALALGAATQSKAMKDSVIAIDNFKRNIVSANYQQTYDLQKSLNKALAGLKFSLECYGNLVKATTFMFDHCKKGDGQFIELWNDITFNFRLNSKSCHDDAGVPYTTKEKMENALKIHALNGSFNPDCILNSKDIIYLTCAKKYRGYKAQEIATQLKLSLTQVNTLLPDCPPAPITPRTISTICRLHKNKVRIDDIIAVTQVDFLKVASIIINDCEHTKGKF